MGHMRPVVPSEDLSDGSEINYIPYHRIWQMTDGRPKLRVIFNASRATSTEYLLNDVMYRGIKQEQELFTELLRWRKHAFVLCTILK